jgi:hypothetical protein
MKAPSLDRDRALLITSSVPLEKGFRFFTDLHKPTGALATSVFDFADQLKKVDFKSLEFHMKRGDFSKWLKEVVKDDSLSSEFEELRSLGLAGEKLRTRLVSLVDKRCKDLASALKNLAHR